ncbi:hypothetical protein BBO99_00005200 [Phytophthora kernoviae]|uniref:PDZ domain-containing protein n=2 Tax=Phytophthora kernoviae TaxID=325452 RepID=A0A3R7KJ76_9STRA|nr:hypothetical protein G195_005475 [Phytophthora kernoviae 00238/432]KAG2524016.1 hypothetical protein JM16_004870 [Phytophthora kernoviae]KAG2525762.1 hypothetical protein JM18_004728 [Phytophthora kernoviae]RLN06284.1 hypothetical protein BBI17_005192 [Phytophthora kernoviae]RLN79497.1 hypothetical protein BBO99_00005200 [Phytophthora kernoviae]
MFAAEGATAHGNANPMTNEELLAHQLDLHQKIQQQMQMQMEMSMQLNTRQSLTASLGKVEPDLGDNVFDMLDDLIMIPSGAVSPERSSLSKQTHEMDDDSAIGSGSVSGNRDSLADILESLDMDLDDDLGDETLSSGSERARSASDSLDEGDFDDLDDLENLDLGLEVAPTPKQERTNTENNDSDTSEPNEHVPAEEEFVHLRRSSLDLLASMSGSASSMSTATGNICTLIWEGGLLGLRLRHSQSRMMPAVSKITGKSSIFGIHLVDVGDLLLRIGGRVTRDMDFLDAINYLKEVPKPCKLVFRRSLSDPMAVKPVQPKVKSEIALKLAAKFEELMAAENEKFPPQPAVKLNAKYEIKWIDGPLGISLIASKDVPYPLVTRITGKNRSPQVQDVQPGHYLVQIGNYNTADGNFNTAIKFLQKVNKPVSLFFCPGNKKVSARPEPTEDEYDHIWEKKQPLCFTVRPNAAGNMVVADLGSAKSIKVKIKGAPNNVAAFVNSGDRIEWINDDNVTDLTFHESLLKLRTAKLYGLLFVTGIFFDVSEASRSQDKENNKDSDVYEVVWPEGTALGLTLRVHPTTRFPVVARVTGTSNLKNIEHVSPGDILFAANNMNITPQPKFKQTLENLSRLPKPAVLRFRRASSTAYPPTQVDDSDHSLPRGPSLKEREFELIWRENANLGLVFSSDSDVPKVTKVDMDSGGPMLNKVSVGDVLTWIGPMEISGSSFHSSMATLRAIKRPVVLRFYKRGT